MSIKRKFSDFCEKKSHLISKYINNKVAAVLPFAALTFPAVLGMVGLGADASLWMSNKRILQTAADSAVLSAGWEVAQESPELMSSVALKQAILNGYEPDSNGELLLDIIQDNPDGSMILGVTLTQDTESFFSRIVYKDNIRISAYAEAIIDGMAGNFCILSLEENNSDALGTGGSATINMPNCGIAVNSSNNRAMVMNGSVDANVGSVRITGNYDIGSRVDFEYGSLRTGTAPLEDPYADLDVPEHDPCRGRSGGTSVNSSATLSPGVFCGGLNISGSNDITFEPGVYIIEGGDFKVTGSGTLYGEGVSFVLTGSNSQSYAGMDISGSREIDFSAPAEGEPMEGVVFYQDRNAPTRTNLQNKLVGSSEIVINGAIYFPSQGVWYGGDSGLYTGETPCTKLIGRTVTFSGNPILGNNCQNVAVRDLGTPDVRLIR